MSAIVGGTDLLTHYQEMYGGANASSVNQLKGSLEKKDYTTASAEELMDVCKQFESYLVEQVMKQMEKLVPESDENSTVGKYMDFFGDTYTQKLAEQVTESNNGTGLGIAQMLYEQMKRNYNLE